MLHKVATWHGMCRIDGERVHLTRIYSSPLCVVFSTEEKATDLSAPLTRSSLSFMN